MTVLESIVRDLRGMPLREQMEVARYVHQLSETAEKERAEILGETHGNLDGNEGMASARNSVRRSTCR
jgi:hypothetical protein